MPSTSSKEQAKCVFKLILKAEKLMMNPRIEGCLAFDGAGVAMFGMTAKAMDVPESSTPS